MRGNSCIFSGEKQFGSSFIYVAKFIVTEHFDNIVTVLIRMLSNTTIKKINFGIGENNFVIIYSYFQPLIALSQIILCFSTKSHYAIF